MFWLLATGATAYVVGEDVGEAKGASQANKPAVVVIAPAQPAPSAGGSVLNCGAIVAPDEWLSPDQLAKLKSGVCECLNSGMDANSGSVALTVINGPRHIKHINAEIDAMGKAVSNSQCSWDSVSVQAFGKRT